MVDKFWTYIPITTEILEDAKVMQHAIETNFRERQMKLLFDENRFEGMTYIERGTREWDTYLWNTECDGGCCECCDESHVGTFWDLTGRAR
jgi:hypothetical protein